MNKDYEDLNNRILILREELHKLSDLVSRINNTMVLMQDQIDRESKDLWFMMHELSEKKLKEGS